MIFNCEDCMRTVFIPLHKANSNLLYQFYTTVSLLMPMLYLSVYICINFFVCVCLIGE